MPRSWVRGDSAVTGRRLLRSENLAVPPREGEIFNALTERSRSICFCMCMCMCMRMCLPRSHLACHSALSCLTTAPVRSGGTGTVPLRIYISPESQGAQGRMWVIGNKKQEFPKHSFSVCPVSVCLNYRLNSILPTPILHNSVPTCQPRGTSVAKHPSCLHSPTSPLVHSAARHPLSRPHLASPSTHTSSSPLRPPPSSWPLHSPLPRRAPQSEVSFLQYAYLGVVVLVLVRVLVGIILLVLFSFDDAVLSNPRFLPRKPLVVYDGLATKNEPRDLIR